MARAAYKNLGPQFITANTEPSNFKFGTQLGSGE